MILFAFPTFKIYCKSISYPFIFCTSSMYPIFTTYTYYCIQHCFSATNATWVLLARWFYNDLPNFTHHYLCINQIHFQAFTLKCTFATINFFLLFCHALRYHHRTIFFVACPLYGELAFCIVVQDILKHINISWQKYKPHRCV